MPCRPFSVVLIATAALLCACSDRTASPASPAILPSPPTLAVVHTLDQLRHQPPIIFPNGLQAHLGIDTDHADGNAHVLLFCLTPLNPPPVSDHAIAEHGLGPFTITRTVDGQKEAEMMDGSENRMIAADHGEALFIVSVRATGHDTVLTLTDTNELGRKTTLATATVTVGAPTPSLWTAITYPPTVTDAGVHFQHDDHGDCLIVPGQPARNHIARPAWDGEHPILILSATWTALPQAIPDQVDDALHLTATPTSLDLTWDRPLLICSPTDVILARWWVNGQPVLPNGPPPEQLGECRGMACIDTRHLRLDPLSGLADLGAKSGDHIAVQLMLCPNGWRPDGDDQLQMLAECAARDDAPMWPRLSNRAEFVMP